MERSPVKIDTVFSHCHCNFFNTELCGYLEFFASRDVGVINAPIFNMEKGCFHFVKSIPPSWNPVPKPVHVASLAAMEYCRRTGISIKRLAFLYALREQRICTILTEMET